MHDCFISHGAGGLIDPTWCSTYFVEALRSLPDSLTEGEVRRPELLLKRDGELEMYFTPFDWVNPNARVLIVGLTPGLSQMYLAVTAAAASLKAGHTLDEALVHADETASFAGSMRTRLIAGLDGIGLHAALGIRNSAELFGARSDLVSTTSAICHATFARGRNYAGTPPVDTHPLLRAFATQVLTANLAMVPDALVIPLGIATANALTLAKVDARRVLFDFPHPSGANGHWGPKYAAAREAMSATVVAWFRDERAPRRAAA
jgi:hypothetical protein